MSKQKNKTGHRREFPKGEHAYHWQGGPIQRLCLNCGKEFFTPKGEVDKGKGKYCSRSCTARSPHRKHRSALRTKCICVICKKEFLEYTSRMKEKNRGTCCSRSCRIIHTKQKISGEKNWQWKGGMTEERYIAKIKLQLQKSHQRQKQWVSKKIIPRVHFCESCNKKLYFKSGNIKNTMFFDHRIDGKEHINEPPKGWLSQHVPSEENIRLWQKSDFGILCHQCNVFLPTKKRKEFLRNIIKYVFNKYLPKNFT